MIHRLFAQPNPTPAVLSTTTFRPWPFTVDSIDVDGGFDYISEDGDRASTRGCGDTFALNTSDCVIIECVDGTYAVTSPEGLRSYLMLTHQWST